MNDIDDYLSDGTNTSSTHNNKESADNGLNNTDEAKEDTNNDSGNDNVNGIDDDLAGNDPDYTNAEEKQNPKLRVIQSGQGNKKKKKRKKEKKKKRKKERKKRGRTGGRAGRTYLKIATQPLDSNVCFTPEEVDSNPVKKAKLRCNEYGLIAPIPKDGNDLVDKNVSDSHHIKSIYFNDEDAYAESFNLNQDEHNEKIIEKLNDTEESMTINQNSEQTYD